MTAQTDTLDPFDAAFAEAMDELGMSGDGTPEADPIEPLTADQADETESIAEEEEALEDGEQAQEVLEPLDGEDDEDDDELFADLEADFEDQTSDPDLHSLPGIDDPVTTDELRNGYLRQADYTKKTQELATERQRLEKADAFYKALTESPRELARQLAEAAGLIEPGSAPVKVVDLPFRPPEEIQAEIDQKVEEALANHPDVVEAQQMLAVQAVEAEFGRIEEAKGITLGPKSRQLVLETAVAKGTDDLEMVVDALLARQQAKGRQTQALRQAAPAKPTGKATTAAVVEPVSTFEDAAREAAKELGIALQLD